MNGYAGRLVDDNQVIVLVDNADGLSSHGRFMTVEGVGDYIAVFDDYIDGGSVLAIEYYAATFYSVFLTLVSCACLSSLTSLMSTG